MFMLRGVREIAAGRKLQSILGGEPGRISFSCRQVRSQKSPEGLNVNSPR
jgi:hypothetical protein